MDSKKSHTINLLTEIKFHNSRVICPKCKNDSNVFDLHDIYYDKDLRYICFNCNAYKFSFLTKSYLHNCKLNPEIILKLIYQFVIHGEKLNIKQDLFKKPPFETVSYKSIWNLHKNFIKFYYNYPKKQDFHVDNIFNIINQFLNTPQDEWVTLKYLGLYDGYSVFKIKHKFEKKGGLGFYKDYIIQKYIVGIGNKKKKVNSRLFGRYYNEFIEKYTLSKYNKKGTDFLFIGVFNKEIDFNKKHSNNLLNDLLK